MANMNFKANILPASSQSYNLGSSTQQWVVYGPIHSNGLYGTPNIDYGDTLPVTATEGQIFFQTSDTVVYSVPSGGTAGYALIKNSNNSGDYSWQPIQTQIDVMDTAEILGGTATYPRTMRADALKAALSTLGGSGLTFTHNSINGIKLDHTNSVTAKSTYQSSSTTAAANGGSIVVRDVQYDTEGHITASQDRTITLGLTTGYGDTTNPYASKTKNTVLAAPANSNGIPTFRKLAEADLPNLPMANATGVLAIAHGGTGAATAENAWTNLGGGSAGKVNLNSCATHYLAGNGQWTAPPGTYVLPAAVPENAENEPLSPLGGVRIGAGIDVDNGTISVDWDNAPVSSVNGQTGDVVLANLTIGNKIYNGTAPVIISTSDLGLASPMTFKGVTDTQIVENADTKPINIISGGILGQITQPDNGTVVLQKDENVEYIYVVNSETGNGSWQKLGLASSFSLAEHNHGYLIHNGSIQEATTASNGDRLLITDSSDSNRIIASNLVLDGTSTQAALSKSGAWIDYLKLSGGTMTGAVKTKGLIGTLDIDYGDVLPTTATEGQIFFQVSYGDAEFAVPGGGTAGYALVKNSNIDGDLAWRPAIPQGGTAGFALVKRSNADGDYTWGPAVPTGGTTGQALIKNSDDDGDTTWSTISADDRVLKAGDTMTGNLTMAEGTSVVRPGVSKSWINGRDTAIIRTTSYSGYDAISSMKTTDGAWEMGVYTSNNLWFTYTPDTQYSAGTNSGYTQCHIDSSARIWGAVWNDYAEFRKDNIKEKELQQPGRCVLENGDGTLTLTQKRLERGCEIISDTFGFAIGQNEENGYNTPIASSGRVLAYPYESIEEFRSHIGWPVCSGPNGTVSIMTEEEEEKYPSRIIGTISEIPDYQIWGSGNVEVNNRIWIRIR